jgi:hypothetical protein
MPEREAHERGGEAHRASRGGSPGDRRPLFHAGPALRLREPGLLAVAIVLVSAIAACVTTGKGVRARAQGLPSANWWLLSTLILVMPIALVLGPLG